MSTTKTVKAYTLERDDCIRLDGCEIEIVELMRGSGKIYIKDENGKEYTLASGQDVEVSHE